MSESLDDTIRRTAIEQLGVVNTSIVRVQDRDGDSQLGGDWFALSVKLLGDVEWKLLGRRRTRQELLTLTSTLDPRHLDGRNFGRTID